MSDPWEELVDESDILVVRDTVYGRRPDVRQAQELDKRINNIVREDYESREQQEEFEIQEVFQNQTVY